MHELVKVINIANMAKTKNELRRNLIVIYANKYLIFLHWNENFRADME